MSSFIFQFNAISSQMLCLLEFGVDAAIHGKTGAEERKKKNPRLQTNP